jgi:integrase
MGLTARMAAAMLFPEMPQYHLIKRKLKDGKTYYHAAFLSEERGKNGRPRYRAVENTGIEVSLGKNKKPTKQGLLNAGRAAEAMLKKGTVLSSRDNLEEFLLDFWNETKSEYLRSRYAETGRRYAESYLHYNLDVIQRYFLPYAKKANVKTLKDVTPIFLERWRNHIVDIVGSRTVNKARQAVWVPLRYAVNRKMIPVHPGEGIRAVQDKKKEKAIFEIEELVKLFGSEWPDIRCYAAAMLSVTTGMRISEVRGLQVKNINFEKGTVDVLTSWADSEGLKSPKWGKVRRGLVIKERVRQAIEAVLKVHRYGARPDDFVFFSMMNHLRPVSYDVLTKGLKVAVKKAGLPPGRSFHNLRHTYVSHAIHKLSPAALRDYIGHSDLKTTEGYQHLTNADRVALKSLADAMLPGAEKPAVMREITLTVPADTGYMPGDVITISDESGRKITATVKEVRDENGIRIVGN